MSVDLTMTQPIACACGATPVVKCARREGEGEDEDGNLITTHCYEAWVDCPACGRHTERMNIECWSEERPIKERLTKADIAQAKEGAIQSWNKKFKTGWWNPEPYNFRKKPIFHYIGKDGRSLCGKWLHLLGELDDCRDDHPENCKACQKKKEKLDKKAERENST